MAEASAALECFFAMLGKTDGRDKMLATLQYCAMFVGGMDKNATATTIFKALGGARKPFRFVKVRGRRSISDEKHASGREHEAPSPSHLLAPGARGSARTRIGRTHQLEGNKCLKYSCIEMIFLLLLLLLSFSSCERVFATACSPLRPSILS